MGSTVAQNRETIQRKGGTHDSGKRSGAITAPLSNGNCENGLSDSHADRADFFDRQALLAITMPRREKSL